MRGLLVKQKVTLLSVTKKYCGGKLCFCHEISTYPTIFGMKKLVLGKAESPHLLSGAPASPNQNMASPHMPFHFLKTASDATE